MGKHRMAKTDIQEEIHHQQQKQKQKTIRKVSTLGTDLRKRVIENSGEPCVESCHDILKSIENEISSLSIIMKITIISETSIGKTIVKCIKSFKRHRRTASTTSNNNNNDQVIAWKELIDSSESMVSKWKNEIDEYEKGKKRKLTKDKRNGQNKKGNNVSSSSQNDEVGYPRNVSVY